MTAPLPANENERLAALRSYEILDTPPEPAFEGITRLAAFVCGTAAAFMSLVDSNRLWFKARIGFEAGEIPREIAFCAYTILGKEPLVVGDACADSRFKENPLVTGEPHIRFYAGAPLFSSDGYALGTLCAVDQAPREITPAQLEALQSIAHLASAQLEFRRLAGEHFGAMKALRESEQRYRTTIQNAVHGIFRTSPQGEFLDVNPALVSMLGYNSREDLLPVNISTDVYCNPADRQRLLDRIRSTDYVEGVEVVWKRKDGCFITVRLSSRVIRDPRGAVDHFETIAEDVTERVRSETALREAHARLTTTLREMEQRNLEMARLSELSEYLQSCQSSEEAYSVAGKAVRELFPRARGALAILPPSRDAVEVVSSWGDAEFSEPHFAPDDCWALRRGRPHLVDDPASPLRCRHLRPGGWSCALCVPLTAQGEPLGLLLLQHSTERTCDSSVSGTDGQRRLATAVAEQIALSLANLRLRETLRMQSTRDPLTSLYNRRFLEEWLAREFRRAARHQRPLAVISLDIDHFKRFNDTFGHEGGDLLLRELGAFLKVRFRSEDIACRFGGEEFVLVLSEATLQNAADRAEQLRRDVNQLALQHRGRLLGRITISCGVAAYPEHGSSPDELLRSADLALYSAKEQGRDRVVLASPPPPTSPETPGTDRVEPVPSASEI